MSSPPAPSLEVSSWKYIWTVPWTTGDYWWKAAGGYVESAVFPADATDNVPIFRARAYPRGRSYYDNENLCVEIISHNKYKVCAKFELSVLNEKRIKFKSVNSPTLFLDPADSKFSQELLLLKTIMDNTNKLMPLTILVEGSVVVTGSANFSVQPCTVHHKLCEDFRGLFHNKQFCDITLAAAGGLELKAHKAILAARSEVFAAMLEHEMKEKKLNRVCIDDTDYKVLNEMVCFMYTGEAPNLDSMAENLFTAADKYALLNLKEMCKESLHVNISIKNAINTLILADMHNDKELKSHAINFIVRNAVEVTKTLGWKDAMTTHPSLIAEMFVHASETKI